MICIFISEILLVFSLLCLLRDDVQVCNRKIDFPNLIFLKVGCAVHQLIYSTHYKLLKTLTIMVLHGK